MRVSFLKFIVFLLFITSNNLFAVDWADGATVAAGTFVRDTTLTLANGIAAGVQDARITIQKDVYIQAHRIDTSVHAVKCNINLQNPNADYGHLIFWADTNRTINVYCDYDLRFRSYISASNANDMLVTFSGAGQTIFHLSDYNLTTSHYYRTISTAGSYGLNYIVGHRGAQVSLEGTAGGGYNYPGETFTQISSYNPCRMNILMDQTETGAITNGVNKVVIKRNPGGYGPSGSGRGIYYHAHPVGMHIDDACFITYLSIDNTGESGADLTGYGAMAFDVTHTGKGAMYLDIDQKNNSDAGHGGFNDGGIAIFGHYTPSWSEADIRANTDLSVIAGKKAIFRIIDNDRYNNANIGTNNVNPTDDYARGLLVINRNTTVPKFAADPYQEQLTLGTSLLASANHPLRDFVGAGNGWYWDHFFSWKQAPNMPFNVAHNVDYNVQTGFILGKNGRIDISHKTYLDYVATLTNSKTDQYLAQDYSAVLNSGNASTDLAQSSYLKKKNPTALFVDGLYGPWNAAFNAETDAEIYLYGDSKILLHAGSKLTTDPTTNAYIRPVYVQNHDYVLTFTVDSAAYNGQYVPGSNVTGGEGKHVLDLEAPLTIQSYDRSALNCHGNYNPVTSASDIGQLNLPTVSIDTTGREYDYTGALGYTDDLITRALEKNSTYYIYDSPSILLNSHLRLYDITFNHSDVTKLLTPNPLTALPNMIGGERKYFNDTVNPNAAPTVAVEPNYIWPRFELYNSSLDMHEHFVASGFKFVVNEIDDDNPDLAANTTVFKFYDHGKQLDSIDHGYGRLFMASCSNNKMSDGSSNATLEHCALNVFRKYDKATLPAVPTETIKLSLETENEETVFLGPLLDAVHANHLFLLNRSTNGSAYMSLGWTMTVGDKTKYPWETPSYVRSNYFDIKFQTIAGAATDTPPATVSIDGNYIYFGGTDSLGTKAIIPVISQTQGSVVYVNHGGRITATQPSSTEHGYDVFMDLPITYNLWSYYGLYGVVDLPKDQVMFGYGYGQQPYNINTVTIDQENPGIPIGTHFNVYNNANSQGYTRVDRDRFAGEEFIIAWNKRTDQNTPVKLIEGLEGLDYDTSDLNLSNFENDLEPGCEFKTMQTRFTAIVDEPVTMPANVVYFGAGVDWADIVTQLKVAGSTMADPIHILIDGYASGAGYAWIKEIVSLPSNPAVPGEGDHAIIFLRNGGRVGLGNNSWNQHSINSWKLLGKDYVTIAPAGNCSIDLNSDVFVVDRGAFVAATSFGQSAVQRLSINLNGNDLYIPANGELDLSSFGHTAFRQEIEFSGEGRVILGHGAVIRFPGTVTPTSNDEYPVLYFNDNTRLVVEDDPEVAKAHYTTITAADPDKVKIIGKGQIWLNKDAMFEVMGGAKVRVGTDSETVNTDLIISIQRQGDFVIGDEQEAGGTFEVGNPTDLAGTINFELKLNGSKARTHLDRGGFLGFGVGMIDNVYDNMNGTATLGLNPNVIPATGVAHFTPDTTNGWKVQTLYDVNNVTITVGDPSDCRGGTFDHSNIFNGSNRLAAIVAVGPINGSYTLDLPDPLKSKILGGGNVMYLDRSVTKGEVYPITANINAWDFADPKLRQEWVAGVAEDYGMYSIMASSPITLQWYQSEFTAVGSTLTTYSNGGKKFVTTTPLDFFTYIKNRKYADLRTKLIDCGATEYEVYVGYVNTPTDDTGYGYACDSCQIFRRTNINITGEGVAEDGLERGILGATGTDDIAKIVVAGRK